MSAGRKGILGIGSVALGLLTYWFLSTVFMPVRPSVTPELATSWRLFGIATFTMEYYGHEANEKEKESIRNLRTPEELYSLLHAKWKNKGHPSFHAEEKIGFERDAWNRPFMLKVKLKGRYTYLQVISSGENGKFEDGWGDDRFFGMVFDGKEVIRATVSTVKGGITDLLSW